MNGASPGNSRYRGDISPIPGLRQLETEWRALENTATCSYFLSWSWIGSWLQLVNDQSNLLLYRCYCDNDLIALAIIASSDIKRRFFFRSRVLTLNELPNKSLNMFIEYNGILAKRGHEFDAMAQLLDDIHHLDSRWDEIQLTNVPQECYQHLCKHDTRLQAREESAQTIWISALNADTSLDSIAKQLSRNWRWKLRRSFKEYEKDVPLQIDAARSVDEALEYFRQMGVLHTQRWQRVGITGSFAHENWVSFHSSLIQQSYDRGEIQLLRITCGARAIGYIYNFLWRGSVHMLQSGFVSEQNNVLRPGYVSHILAMQFNAQRGATQYDFMTGDAEYKRILATAYPPLISARLQKPRPKFFIENLLVAMYRKFRQHSSRLSLRQIKSVAQQSTGGFAIATNLESIIYFLSLTRDLI